MKFKTKTIKIDRIVLEILKYYMRHLVFSCHNSYRNTDVIRDAAIEMLTRLSNV